MSDLPDFAKPVRDYVGDASIKEGCYRVLWKPSGRPAGFHYDGTVRLQRSVQQTLPHVTVSGDLYAHETDHGVDLPNQIPIYPLNGDRYTYASYIRVKAWGTQARHKTIECEILPCANRKVGERRVYEFMSQVDSVEIPLTITGAGQILEGPIIRNGSQDGTIKLVRVSPFLRKATVVIEKTQGHLKEEAWPQNNDDGQTADVKNWKNIFNAVGWDVKSVRNERKVNEDPDSDSWAMHELHTAMKGWLTAFPRPNDAWYYYLLCVRSIYDNADDYLGIMFDTGGSDSNSVSRKGAALSWGFPVPPEWKITPAGVSLILGQTKARWPYFRTAIHETGHTMGLHHENTRYYMGEAADMIRDRQYPAKIAWSFSGESEQFLRHAPDVYVRPGGIPFNDTNGEFGERLDETPGVHLDVSSLSKTNPWGAPLRIGLSLRNDAAHPIEVAENFGMKSGSVIGWVVDPYGRPRSFSPMVLYANSKAYRLVPPGRAARHTVTLLRGRDGALTPVPGRYHVIVQASFMVDRELRRTRGMTTVIVTRPKTARHRRAARAIAHTPETLPALVVGGNQFKEGVKVIRRAARDPSLQPHYAMIQSTRLSSQFGEQPRLFEHECLRIKRANAVLSPNELRALVRIILGVRKRRLFDQGERLAVEGLLRLLERRSRTERDDLHLTNQLDVLAAHLGVRRWMY